MPDNEAPLCLRRPNPHTLAFSLVVLGVELVGAALKLANPQFPFVGLALVLCLTAFGTGWERLGIGDRDGAKAGVKVGMVALLGMAVWFKWGIEGIFALLLGLAVIGLPLQLLVARRQNRADEAVRNATPVFPEKEQEKRPVFLRLLPRILVAAVARTEGGFTEVERVALLDLLLHELKHEAPRPDRIRALIRQAEAKPPDLDTLLWFFHKNCSYESHLILVAMLLRLIYCEKPPKQSGVTLVRDMARNLGIAAADRHKLKVEALVAKEDEARREKRLRLEEEERDLLEAEQAREELEGQLGKEKMWLYGVWLGCLILASGESNMGSFFFGLFLLLLPILALYEFVFPPIRHARLARQLSRKRRQAKEESLKQEAAGRDRETR